MNEQRKQQYFSEIAPTYATFTGNTTQDIFAKFLETNDLGITPSSIIHDNASGPGTATQILASRAVAKNLPLPRILATDYVPAMISVIESMKSQPENSEAWSDVDSCVLNSNNLTGIPDNHFTHSISNFSLFTITDPVQSLRETRRTLQQPGGTAVVLVWKRFAVEKILARAQDIVKGDGYAAKNAVPVNGPQFFQEGVVAAQLVEAGFESDRIQTSVVEILLKPVEKGGDKWKWDGLVDFFNTSSIAMLSTRGFDEQEKAQWKFAISRVMMEEVEQFGGVKFEGWVTVART